jgi:hypothetical protein
MIGCVNTALKCKASTNPCSETYCNDTSIVCASRPVEPVPVVCQNKTIPECEDATYCNDRTNCTTDSCIGGKCVYNQIPCPLTTKCSITTCKPTIGCHTVNISSNCDDGDMCTTDSCDDVLGCINKNVTCAPSKDPCYYTFCSPTEGCLTSPATCNLTAENCTIPACNQTCYLKFICPTIYPDGEENAPPTTIILASTLTTAAIVGIVCGGVILAAGLGGGAVVAVGGAAGAGGVTAVFSNPTYAGTALSGNNPLAQNA